MLIASVAASRAFERPTLTGGRGLSALVSPVGNARAAPVATQVTLGAGSTLSAVYGDPRAQGPQRLWASPASRDDTVSALMSRNRELHSYALSDQWRGLGGALLRQLADTGQNYAQTLSDDYRPLIAVDGADAQDTSESAAEILTQQMDALHRVAINAATATLKIQTRSGQAVELKMAVNSDALGMQVDIRASGTLSDSERGAIKRLADGLDRALEGLGQQDHALLDLSGLMDFDRSALAGLDLAIDNPMPGTVLDRFALHLGDDRLSVAMKGSDGEMNLTVNAAQRSTRIHAAAQSQALQQMLQRIDRAAERGHANAALVAQLKSAFTTLQQVAGAQVSEHAGQKDTETLSIAVNGPGASGRRVQMQPDSVSSTLRLSDSQASAEEGPSPLSGLADFEVGLSGDSYRLNRSGTINEAGMLQYQLRQKTADAPARDGRQSVVQSVSEQLSADFRKAPGDRMLDVRNGNFSDTRIRDRSTVTTLVESANQGASRVLRRSESEQLKTFTEFQDHRQTSHRVWPHQASLVQRIR